MIFFHFSFPSSTISNSSSIFAVNLTLNIFSKYLSSKSVTISPSSVGTIAFFSFFTYLLSIIVFIVGEYVLGLPIPFASNTLTRLASVYLAGGSVNDCFLFCFFSLKISFSYISGSSTNS